MKKLYLVDVSSMFFRAYFAIPPLSTEEGLPTNALYGFMSMTMKLLRQARSDYMAFCFDRKEPSFRNDMYEDYKANRDEMPEDLQPQIPYIKKLTDALGIPRFDKKGFEADDIIGTLTEFGRSQDLEVIIVSGDKDFAQLVQPFVSMYDTMKEKRYDEEGVVEKWGVKPEQMLDYLSMVGDASDNVPGVRGIGPKGAQKLLAEHKTLEGIYKNLDKVTGKAMKRNLEEGEENAFLSKKLITIVRDVDLGIDTNGLKLKEINKDELHDLLTTLEFTSFEKSILGKSSSSKESASSKKSSKKTKKSTSTKSGKNTTAEFTPANVDETKWTLSELDKALEPFQEVWGLLSERGFYIGVNDKVGAVEADSKELGKMLSKKNLQWKGFDLKETWKALDISNPTASWDQMLAAYVARAGNIENFDKTYEQYTGKKTPDIATPGALLSCHQELEFRLKEKLEKLHGEGIYRQVELPLIPVLYEMEREGILLDTKELEAQSKTLGKDLEKLEKKVFKESGEAFNIASPKQLGAILFEKMGIPPSKKTKTGFSTSSDVLEKLREEFPICGYVLEYRELAKLKSTYVDALPQLVNKETGRIHTHFRQAATATGRLSSVNPNLQNIPIRTERGRLVRKAFHAKEGNEFISADYSQIELRVLAHITEDEGLLRAFRDDLDIHTATASEIYNVSFDEVTADLRRAAKAVNFGIAYGQGAFGLSESLGISRGEASEIIERYFSRFKKVRQYMTDIVDQAKSNGYVETMFGRRRYIDELQSKNGNIRKFGERAAINAPIQGAASDLVKMAMIELDQSVTARPLLQVHDELLFSCPKEDLDDEMESIRETMEGFTSFKVPLKINLATGHDWQTAHA